MKGRKHVWHQEPEASSYALSDVSRKEKEKLWEYDRVDSLSFLNSRLDGIVGLALSVGGTELWNLN